MPSYADIEEKMNAAVAAIEAGDFDGAINKALAAQGLFSILPEAEKRGNAGERVAWNPDSINQFIENLRKQNSISGKSVSASKPFVSVPYQHQSPYSSDCEH